MKFESLRLAGFKTFVEPCDIMIAPGLTGIVGPNGCGKSNLVEALRWVMGETSSKSLRGGGMEDVIFAGSAKRPERNHAEVSIRIGSPPPDLPGHLAGAESLDISRKITREHGSAYRINGREVRARDVQILFADAASGARSPSLVRQGQISEIIAAKPQHRRRILEDAAGIGGLHTRRHEAELRLKAAEDNLSRAEDVLGQLDKQAGELKKQARQSAKYRALSAEIRQLELAVLAHALVLARKQAVEAQSTHDAAIRALADAMNLQASTERERALAAHHLEELRKQAALAATALQDHILTRERLDQDIAQTEKRLTELSEQQGERRRDGHSARQTLADAQSALARLNAEQLSLTAQQEEREAVQAKLHVDVVSSRAAEAEAEAAYLTAQGHLAQMRADKQSVERTTRDLEARSTRLQQEITASLDQQSALLAADHALQELPKSEAMLAQAGEHVKAARAKQDEAEAALQAARAGEQMARPRLAEAERTYQRLETEAKTIRKMVEGAEPKLWPSLLEQITVEKGYETALGAALGEDLEAALDVNAPLFWDVIEGADIPPPPLPEGAEPLAAFIKAPPALAARLCQIGFIDKEKGAKLQHLLKQGQRLVSREGDVWRWDGLVIRAEAPSAAARRLAERNRLADVEMQAQTAREAREAARSVMEGAIRTHQAAQAQESAAREATRRALQMQEAAQTTLSRLFRQSEEARLRLATLKERITRFEAEKSEVLQALEEARKRLAALPDHSDIQAELIPVLNAVETSRSKAREARTAFDAVKTSHESAQTRLRQIAAEQQEWQARSERAERSLAEQEAREEKLLAEISRLTPLPDALRQSRLSLADKVDAARRGSEQAGDALAKGESAARMTSEAAREALHALSTTREAVARAETAQTHADERVLHAEQAVSTHIEAPIDTFDPQTVLAEASLDAHGIDKRLAEVKEERERLGIVNLRAEIELQSVETTRDNLAREREEITQAIQKFRRAIDSLNTEGRARLKIAFSAVNTHFTMLFTRLFGGGEAELQLIEADDPLEAGLEIIARPPGKKPQLLTLLSGGEQALTATALIFAVFLSNPAPICVLDEVDAPLDDANVERLCALLRDMARETQTRFLIITHNPISMAQMDRLYGVTMIERGVSQIVSVDLALAERLAEAG